MISLQQFIREEKNVHMEHIDDLPFNEGVDGMRRAINFLRDLRDMLAGNSKTKVTATVKWDGAPAVFAGIDPRDGKFFVAKKGVFNKTPKVYKTAADVDADVEGDLAVKLKTALAEFKKLGIRSGVYQGDIMFTSDTLKKQTIDDQPYITFHPNTIIYAVPAGTPEARRIQQAKIGVVWHTTYTGDSFESMAASFGKPIVDKLSQTSSVWMVDATYHDYSGTATFTKQETDHITSILSQGGKMFQKINGRALDQIRSNPAFLELVKTYNNSKIRAGQTITNTQEHVAGLFHFIYDKLQKEIDEKKTPAGKQAATAKRDQILSWFRTHDKNELVKIYDLINVLITAKHMIVGKMNQAGHLPTFVQTTTGFRATTPEGYVAIDHLSGGAVKLVNRMEFSRSNFDPTVIKGWQK